MITEKNFNLLDDLNTELSIRIRKKCPSARTRGCPLRREEVMVIKKLDTKDGNISKMQEKDGLLK
jgi:hypothetical protein